MSNLLRKLNDDGIQAFGSYLQSLREGGNDVPPFHLLTDPAFSLEQNGDVEIEIQDLPNSYAVGVYLDTALASLDRRAIAYDHRIWSWLALSFFDQVCPLKSGARDVLEDSVYILAKTYNHRRYYRHLLRTPWLAVSDHKEKAKVLLLTKAGGARSDISEQIGAQQTMFGNKTLIAGAYKLYFDETAQVPKRGASGKGAGSPRRLVAFVRQIDRTYDLRDCTADQFVTMLPKEFDRFKGVKPPPTAKKNGLKKLLTQFLMKDTGVPSSSSATAE